MFRYYVSHYTYVGRYLRMYVSPIKVDNFFPIILKKIPRKCNKIQEHFLNVGKLQISFLTTAIRAVAVS